MHTQPSLSFSLSHALPLSLACEYLDHPRIYESHACWLDNAGPESACSTAESVASTDGAEHGREEHGREYLLSPAIEQLNVRSQLFFL